MHPLLGMPFKRFLSRIVEMQHVNPNGEPATSGKQFAGVEPS